MNVATKSLLVLHRVEVFTKMRVMGAKGSTRTKPLTEEKAVEMGAELLGETFVLAVAASIVLYEYWRSSLKEASLEAAQDKDIDVLQMKFKDAEERLTRIENKITGLEQNIKEV